MATPVLRSVPCANKRYCKATGKRTTGFRKRNSNFLKPFSFTRNVNLAHSHTAARPIPPPPPPSSNTVVPFFFGSFLNTSIIHKTAQLRPLSCQSVLFLVKTRSRTRFSSCDRRTNSAVVEQRDRGNGESVHFRFRA